MKGFLIVVLVVAALLLVLFVLGAGRVLEMDRPNVRALSNRLGSGRHLPLGELEIVSPACGRHSAGLHIEGICSMRARPSDEPVWKRRAVAFVTDGKVKVQVKPNGDSPAVEGTPDAGEESEFAIPREGARIDLTCSSGKCPITWK